MIRKIATVVGARPQFIKAAVLSRLILEDPDVEEILIHTGQHFDANMSDVFFKELAIPEPAFKLNIAGGSHGQMTGRMMEALDQVFVETKPDAILVYGDTNSTLAGALTAAKIHIPVLHVEAGLRSFNMRMPEEINRRLTDHMSTMMFCPTGTSVQNLANEGVTENVFHVGDIMYDATIYTKDKALKSSTIIEDLGLEQGGFSLCTLHRAENTDDPERFESMCRFIEQLADNSGPVVFPVHPRTRKILEKTGRTLVGVRLIEPLGYFDIHRLLADAQLLMTNLGGMQKEAYFHRTPCVTMRDETEWVELIDHGWNRLWNDDTKRERRDVSDYGSGDTGAQILNLIKSA